MLLHKIADNGPEYYCFDNLSCFSGLEHGVFTRKGGTSTLNFDSLNVGLSTGDDKESVYLNRKMVAHSMGAAEDHAVYLNQVHGKEFLVLKQQHKVQLKEDSIDRAMTSEDCKVSLQGVVIPDNDADGIITNIQGVLTVIQVADCQAVILYDPVNKVLANIHSGWRGSVLNIIGRGVDIMVEQFNSEPRNIIGAISPSLGPCCAEFKNYKSEIPEPFWKYKICERYFDFWRISHDQLTAKGVLSRNIEVAKICTRCSSYMFYSYRKENITGRFAVAAGLISSTSVYK